MSFVPSAGSLLAHISYVNVLGEDPRFPRTSRVGRRCCLAGVLLPRSERRRKGPSLEGLSLPNCGPARQGQRFETAGDQGNDDVMRNLKYMAIDMHQ